jgi:SAM-dependent methyltransferase
MRDVIPTGMGADSEYLFARMTGLTLDWAEAAPGRRVLDVASGPGADVRTLVDRGAYAVGVEPSSRMLGLARVLDAEREAPQSGFVQAWGDPLPFADDSFDAALCKGSLDHFDQPEAAIAEMARVTRPTGRVVLAIANFESLACRLARRLDAVREEIGGAEVRPGRRMYDVPSDHFTRYERDLMIEQAGRHLHVDRVEGISLGWGFPGWAGFLHQLPARVARGAVQLLGEAARRVPSWADVILVAGPPRSASTSR